MRERARQLRHTQTGAEAQLWRALRNRQLGGLKFRRQVPIDRFIVDYCCVERRLVVEVDGTVHDVEEQAAYDVARTAALEMLGYRVIRFANRQVEGQLADVLTTILREAER